MTAAYLQWEIWDVDWQHQDGTSKVRPALLIATGQQADSMGRLPFLQITGSEAKSPHRYDFKTTASDFRQTGLTKDCFLYMNHFQWVEKADIKSRRGTISADLATALRPRIHLASGFTPP